MSQKASCSSLRSHFRGTNYDPSLTRRARSRPHNCRLRELQTASRRAEAGGADGRSGIAQSGQTQGAKEKLTNREFYLNLLNSAATKRDAKAYLSRFKASDQKAASRVSRKLIPKDHDLHREAKPGVNLGNFFAHTRAVGQSPVFDRRPELQHTIGAEHGMVHVALVKWLNPQICDDGTVIGIGQTLAHLSQLGMLPCIVVDVNAKANEIVPVWRKLVDRQIDRITMALEEAGANARRIDSLFTVSTETRDLRMLSRESLVRPLRQGHIPVIAPIAFNQETTKVELSLADTAIIALTRELAGLNLGPSRTDNLEAVREDIKSLQNQFSLDRLILLDPWGGIPNLARSGNAHVFINLEQEYDDIVNDLLNSFDDKAVRQTLNLPPADPEPDFPGTLPVGGALHHIKNVQLVQDTLKLLPPSSSALITTVIEATNSNKESEHTYQVSGVGTRRQKNPLIHNLLTDKPAHSSSLPLGRLMANASPDNPPLIATSTFVKRGMPLTILPDPRKTPWVADNYGQPRISLNDPSIDLSRLVHLIEDSFDRKLDVEHYLKRVNDRIAGLIIAGEYEGGALLTWETPPGVPDDGSPASTSRLVPYLDKFAVLKRSQGAGGVADIVFNAMVRGCFPDGVCWRSRKNNPVNKWYFERARGTWKLPETDWTMFWTTEGVRGSLFKDYEGVCRNVVPSWADKKHIVD